MPNKSPAQLPANIVSLPSPSDAKLNAVVEAFSDFVAGLRKQLRFARESAEVRAILREWLSHMDDLAFARLLEDDSISADTILRAFAAASINSLSSATASAASGNPPTLATVSRICGFPKLSTARRGRVRKP